jgi:hypothetical protein
VRVHWDARSASTKGCSGRAWCGCGRGRGQGSDAQQRAESDVTTVSSSALGMQTCLWWGSAVVVLEDGSSNGAAIAGLVQSSGLGLHRRRRRQRQRQQRRRRRRRRRRKGVGSGSNDNAETARRDWSIGNNSTPAASHLQLHTYTSDSAAWITAPLLVFSALNWCDSCESPSPSPSLSYPTAEELPERHVGCTLAARWLHAAWLPSSLLDAPSAVPAAAVLVVHGPPPCAPSS